MLSKVLRYLPPSVADKILNNNSHNIKFSKRALLHFNPNDLLKISNKRVLASFKRAAATVPSYQRYLRRKRVKPDSIKTIFDFQDKVPISTKKNYVKKTPRFRELCVNGDVGQASLLGRSSGYSGKSTTWAKSRAEQQEAENYAGVGLELTYGILGKKTLLIDIFPLGSWVSGVDVIMITDSNCSVIAPGSDIEETLSIFKDLKDEYDQFIFVGTPHILKPLFEEGIRRGINFKKKKVNIMVGAEPFTEEWRQYMHKIIGTSSKDDSKGFIFSGYGS